MCERSLHAIAVEAELYYAENDVASVFGRASAKGDGEAVATDSRCLCAYL